ncbi:hypothetical protein EGR_10714 [Echinococcus granulosus]|uniref:Uncharacterized protein n=1 Tax=Echinococcus granulosus TaxID=6210 RepID=W6U7S3_ECHGR|nr:hypothetical protein EGR_10714 [Echinococcus granulosus]EUB54427.1 hypothetical protein EGR_10714 [Echinococcus granulosus]
MDPANCGCHRLTRPRRKRCVHCQITKRQFFASYSKICPQNYISSPSHLIGEPIEGVDSYAQTWRELLATQHGASVTVTDAYDNTALQSEPKVDSINCVRLIVQHRILVDAVNYPNKLPLMNAMFFQHIDVVRYLIWKDASTTPELCCDSGSALTLASYTACS